jgi:hypothetical protein
MAGLLLASFKLLCCVGMVALGRSPSFFPTRNVPRLPPANISFPLPAWLGDVSN